MKSLKVSHMHFRMFILIGLILLAFYVDAEFTEMGTPLCYNGFCVALSKTVSAETGLCAVIHCTLNIPSNFNIWSLVWYKCEPGQACTDIIFHSRHRSVIQQNYLGRVSLLEPNLSQRNCSFIINDLRLSDSGNYVLTLIGYRDRFSFTFNRATITVKALQQKPTVLTPALTEGQRASLTCTAPGLCSGTEPTFTWTWTGAGHAPPDVTTETTERLTSVNHRHSSTLELAASAELHGAELSCTVAFNRESSSTQATVRLNVTYVKNIEVSGDTVVKEGHALNVTCSADSFPPSQLIWFGPNQKSVNVSESTDLGSASLLIHNITQSQSGQYICEGLHLNSSQTRHVNISVIYLREPVITGDTSVMEGSDLNLNCSVDSFPLANVTLSGGGLYLKSNQTDRGSASLLINNVTVEDAGRYECTAEHELRTLSTSVDVNVLLKPLILSSSGCVYDGDVLSCSCISRASPFPAVTWPMLQHCSEYTLVTTVTGDMLNSSVVLRQSDFNGTVQCVSSNTAGQVHQSFKPSISSSIGTGEPPVTPEKLVKVVSKPEVIVAFLTGFLLAAVLFFVIIKCHRRKQKSSDKGHDMNGTLELVNSETEEELNGHVTYATTEPGELHYASINFSVLPRIGQRDNVRRDETKTVYAEIKREVIAQENEEVQEERPEDTEEAAMMEDAMHNSPMEETEEVETALYSNMKEAMANE